MKKTKEEKAFRKMFNIEKFTKKQYETVLKAYIKARLLYTIAGKNATRRERWRRILYPGVNHETM